jgi:dUTP pyrophosphatase
VTLTIRIDRLPIRPGCFDQETDAIKLLQGAYLIEFNGTVSVPLDYMGLVFVRSSLWRSGVTLTAGAVDASYEGALGALLDVRIQPGSFYI